MSKSWVDTVSRLPLSSPQKVEVANGNYMIWLNDNDVPAFLDVAKRIKWPAARGEYSIHEDSP